MKISYDKLFLELEIIFGEWDPEQLLAMGAPSNEYKSEIKLFIKTLNWISNDLPLTEHNIKELLCYVLTKSFGTVEPGPNLDDMNKILLYPGSIKVIKIYQHNNIPNNIVNDIIFSINNANSI